jgi:hypothetical protein
MDEGRDFLAQIFSKSVFSAMSAEDGRAAAAGKRVEVPPYHHIRI